ncbi:MAG: Uma2 family endonuclease [Bacteroidota bacterium]
MVTTEKINLEAYLELEKKTGERYEWIDGEVKAMAGTTIEHELIVKKLIRLLDECLEEKGCTLVSGQMKMYSPHCQKAFLYPDIHIYCGDLQKEKMPQGAYALVNPSFVIEVLSKDTRNYDRGDKFDCYRKMDSLKSYLMIESQLDSHEPVVHLRTWNGDKNYREDTLGLGEVIDVLDCPLEVKQVFDIKRSS